MGINSENKWNALASKIEESNCDIICIQETKREHFDGQYLKKICHKKFNEFVFLPLVLASGGMIIIWNGTLFKGELLFQNDFSLLVKFSFKISEATWIITNINGPCSSEKKNAFIDWFSNIDMSDDTD
jgi:hypothetical protein